jgi:hypothetical protein
MRLPRASAVALSLFAAACASTSTGQPQEGKLSPDAPPDRPVHVAGKSPAKTLESWRALIAPYVAKARETYPDAKRRYLAGLPPGETFFVTTILSDSEARFEQVFILVDHIEDGVVTGRISDVGRVPGYKAGDVYSFPEADVVDWLISKPDGSEEGNVVGKFIDGLPGRAGAL